MPFFLLFFLKKKEKNSSYIVFTSDLLRQIFSVQPLRASGADIKVMWRHFAKVSEIYFPSPIFVADISQLISWLMITPSIALWLKILLYQ